MNTDFVLRDSSESRSRGKSYCPHRLRMTRLPQRGLRTSGFFGELLPRKVFLASSAQNDAPTTTRTDLRHPAPPARSDRHRRAARGAKPRSSRNGIYAVRASSSPKHPPPTNSKEKNVIYSPLLNLFITLSTNVKKFFTNFTIPLKKI